MADRSVPTAEQQRAWLTEAQERADVLGLQGWLLLASWNMHTRTWERGIVEADMYVQQSRARRSGCWIVLTPGDPR